MLEDNHIDRVLVPANCTDRLQPLDLSVNKPPKEFLRRTFQEWFASQIAAPLEESDHTQQVNSHQVDVRLSIMKPLGARWLVELYYYLPLHYRKWFLCSWHLGHTKGLTSYRALYAYYLIMIHKNTSLMTVGITLYRVVWIANTVRVVWNQIILVGGV